MRNLRGEQKRLQQQPLRNKAIERRQTGNRQRAHQGHGRHPGHSVGQATKRPKASAFGCMQDIARGKKEQALEKRVVQGMQQGRAERECREQWKMTRVKQDGQSNPGKDKADVFNRGVGQQSLHVRFHAGKDGAVYGGEKAKSQHQNSPLPKLDVQQVEGDA